MERVKLSPTPIEREHGFLILRRKLCAVAKDQACRRPGSDVVHRRKIVRVPLRPFSGAIAPAEFAPANRMTNSRGPIPRRVEIVFHIGVIREEFAIAIESGVENISITGGIDFKIL